MTANLKNRSGKRTLADGPNRPKAMAIRADDTEVHQCATTLEFPALPARREDTKQARSTQDLPPLSPYEVGFHAAQLRTE